MLRDVCWYNTAYRMHSVFTVIKKIVGLEINVVC